jgi:NADP-dependent 3-hydroxy acid dehydrogenase YdfG
MPRVTDTRVRPSDGYAIHNVILSHIVHNSNIRRVEASSRAVLVTGCSSGIGRSTALAAARSRLPIWASARKLDSLRELEQAGCRTLELDVTDDCSRRAAVQQIEAGAVGVFADNAGHGGGGPVEEAPLDMVSARS